MKAPRAYSLFTLKSADEQTRTVTGIATTPTTDRMGDIVEPKGAQFALPLPLLWQHDAGQPVGNVVEAKVTDAGIEVRAQFASVTEPGILRDRIDLAWQSVKAQLVRGFSIGFKSIESALIEETYGLRFLKWEWLELSLVTIPANSEASILSVKAADLSALRAASGASETRVVRLKQLPGASGAYRPRRPGAVYLNP